MQAPLPSMILRDTSIREQLSSSSIKDSSSFNSNSGYTSSTFSSRERENGSAFLSSGSNSLTPCNNLLSSLGSRDNNSIIIRDCTPIHNAASRIGSNRFLSGNLDQRIIKQSSEDCRRLLQQVSVQLFIDNVRGPIPIIIKRRLPSSTQHVRHKKLRLCKTHRSNKDRSRMRHRRSHFTTLNERWLHQTASTPNPTHQTSHHFTCRLKQLASFKRSNKARCRCRKLM